MMLEFKNITKSFNERVVLRDISFSLDEGDICFVIGRSGTGKSVLLKHIVGLLKPDSGELWVDGDEVTGRSEKEFLSIRKKCGMVFQLPALIDSLTVFENVAFGLKAHKIAGSTHECRAIVFEKLKDVHLSEEICDRMPTELSFGMQKRVSIARAIALSPKILLFDEPTTGLDLVSTQAINQLIFELSRKLSVTTMVVSHDMHSAVSIADRVVLLDEGRVVANCTTKELLVSKEPTVRAFLGVGNANL